jgi:hypothetical protein
MGKQKKNQSQIIWQFFCQYLRENVDYAKQFVKNKKPKY